MLSALFALSGAIALVYELTWHRKLTLLFGSSAPATAATLTAYFAGLGLGSYLCGAASRRHRNLLRFYGLLEFGIALGALGVDPILHLYATFYPGLVARFGASPLALTLVKGALGMAAVVIPTLAMGGTLPVLTSALSTRANQLGDDLGRLYSLNTLGAACGTVATPALLLPKLGVQKLYFLCVALNIAIGLVALMMAKALQPPAPSPTPGGIGPPEGPALETQAFASPSENSRRRAAYELSFCSGLGLFVLQVLWNRAFAQVHENSLSAFATITAFFILAIAAGGQVSRWILNRAPSGRRILGICWMAGGVWTAIAPVLFIRLTGQLSYSADPHSPLGLSTPLVLAAVLLIFLPVTALSAALPVLAQELSPKGNTKNGLSGRLIGNLVAVNTLGCICGAILGGFILPSWIGLWRSMTAAGILFAGLGLHLVQFRAAVSVFTGLTQKSGLVLAPVVGALSLLFLLPVPRTSVATDERILALEEGAHGIAAVLERTDQSRRLKLNNHYVLGGTRATGDQRLQAHIPLLLSPDQRSAIFLGYGTGITAGGGLFHPGLRCQAVELIPEVASLASRYFAQANEHFGADERSSLILDDARNFLRGTGQKFSTVIGDLVVPWRPGESSLYTVEHFQAVHAALADMGVFCAWVPMFQVNEAQFQMILRTFLEVFGTALLWRGDFSPNQPAYGLLAFKNPNSGPDPSLITANLRAMRPDPLNPQLREAAGLWIQFVGRISLSDLPAPLPRLNSENAPWLELRQATSPHAGAEETFSGRHLQAWENSVREASRTWVAQFPPDVQRSWEAGRWMVDFSHFFAENRRQEAAQAQEKIRKLLGEETFRLIFGL